MRTIAFVAPFLLLAVAGAAQAQEHHHGAAAGSGVLSQSPYAGFERRAIKALSDEEIADLRAGRGMGLALAAELNGFPGPLHVLELTEQLDLSLDQRSRVAAELDAMKRETIDIGEEVIAAEANLDRLFANGSIKSEDLDGAVARIASAEGRLRAAHLRYHVRMPMILSEDQVASYARIRGYSAGHAGSRHSR